MRGSEKDEKMEHYEEGHMNKFCQFMHDGATLKNKDKNQAIGMHFADMTML